MIIPDPGAPFELVLIQVRLDGKYFEIGKKVLEMPRVSGV